MEYAEENKPLGYFYKLDKLKYMDEDFFGDTGNGTN